MTDRITGKVAKVTSDRELVINRGSEHGVTRGMTFRVKGPAVEVTDPDTNEPIGTITSIKVVVRVAEIDEKMSIARTFRKYRVNVGGDFKGISALSGMLQPPKWETRVETLRRDPDAEQTLSESESVVQVGDLVETADEQDLDAETTTEWR